MKRLLLLALLLNAGAVQASEDAPTVKEIFQYVGRDQGAILTSPLRMDSTEAWIWGVTGVSMIVLMPTYNARRSVDEKYVTGIERENAQYVSFFKRLTWLGDGMVLYGASAVSYGVGAVTDQSRVQQVSAHWLEALIDTGLWVTGIKMLAGRNRPGPHDPESEFGGPVGYFKNQGANSSFPSGHSALAFASASVLTREAKGNLWVGVPLYVMAGGVGYSRMHAEKHWFSDVIVGAAIGHSIGMLVENRHHRATDVSWQVEPQLIHDGVVLSWTRRW